MTLKYMGKGEAINGVPARDLTGEDIQNVAKMWGLSLAETEGLLMMRGLYKQTEAPAIEKTSKKKASDE
jgi:hypothetical protein